MFDQAIDYFEVHSGGWVKQVAGEFVIFSIGNEYRKDFQNFGEGNPTKIMPLFQTREELAEALSLI